MAMSGQQNRVDDFVNGVSEREFEEISRALRPGESVRWATRPLTELWELGSAWCMACGILGCGFLAYLLWEGMQGVCSHCPSFTLVPICFSLPFWCIMLWYISAPWRRLRRLRRTLYIITSERALVSEPGFRGWKLRGWSLREGMVVSRREEGRDQGSLVLGMEWRSPIFGRKHMHEAGFLCLGNLKRAEEELHKALDTNRI